MTNQKLRSPACTRRASEHAWQPAQERSTRECEADACQGCGLVRLTSYRTGQVVRYETADDSIRPRHEHREDKLPGTEQFPSDPNELPSVALMTNFLALCRQYGSEQLAVSIVAAGGSTGVPGLPLSNDSTTWNASEMRAAVEHLERKLGM